MASFGVVLVAAGRSSRFNDSNYKKPFAPLAGRSVWLQAAEKFLDHDDVKQVVIVIAPEDREYFLEKFGADIAFLGIKVAEGGTHRSDSVFNGLAALQEEIEFVAIHDAATCLTTQWIDNVFKAATKTGAAILATPLSVRSNVQMSSGASRIRLTGQISGRHRRHKSSGVPCFAKSLKKTQSERRQTNLKWSRPQDIP